ncbi:MAG TPA: hypothetical protein VHO70_18170 [Chitinispirillaceae bacterium]|nr:hypothetical protein [Chitinispirillaceae bacterium]
MNILKNNNGSTLITIVIIAIVLNIALAAFFFSTRNTAKSAGAKRIKTSAFNIAEAGKEDLYSQVSWRKYTPRADIVDTVFSAHPFESGTYTVSCRSNVSLNTLWVTSKGVERTDSAIIETVGWLRPDITINFPPVLGAVTSRSRITVKGNIEIDGRNYDTSNTLVDSGIYGISTCDSMILSGSATVGGNGIAPVNDKNFPSVQETVADEMIPVDARFSSPEAFLGVPNGALDDYVVSSLPTPFRGLYYLKGPYVGPVHFGNSYGILIIHNDYKDAELQIVDGTFHGLIITDRMAKISGNALILGAVVTLCEGEVSTFGTGTAIIRYSKQVLQHLSLYCNNLRKKVQEVSWKQRR